MTLNDLEGLRPLSQVDFNNVYCFEIGPEWVNQWVTNQIIEKPLSYDHIRNLSKINTKAIHKILLFDKIHKIHVHNVSKLYFGQFELNLLIFVCYRNQNKREA